MQVTCRLDPTWIITNTRCILNFRYKVDGLVKSLEIVMPDSIRHPERIELTGFSDKSESSTGLVVIPDPDPGRNDGKENFSTFYANFYLPFFTQYLIQPPKNMTSSDKAIQILHQPQNTNK